MNVARTWIQPIYLGAYSVFLLLVFGWLPPLSGGRPDGALLFGHLAVPERAASIGALAPLFLGAALFLGGPKKALGRASVMLLAAVLLAVMGPLFSGNHMPLSNGVRCAFAGLLLIPLMWMRWRERSDESGEHSPSLPLDIGTFFAGAGLTVALFALERRLALFGYTDPAEAHLRGLVFLSLAAVGAFLIGLPMAKGGRSLAAFAAVLTAAGALIGLGQLAPLAAENGLDFLLRSVGMDLSDLGRLQGSGFIAARALVVPGFAFGVLVIGLNSRRAQSSLFWGAVAARLYWPKLLSGVAAEGMPHVVELGLWLAALGALPLVGQRLMKHQEKRRFLLPAAFLAVVFGTSFLPRIDAKPLSPWLRFKAQALFEADTTFGLLTVETTRAKGLILTMDRVGLTPNPDQVRADSARLIAALDLMAANWQAGDPDLDVLFAGQLTLPRLEAFDAWKEKSKLPASLAWSTPWDALQGQIRPLLEASWRLPAPLPFDEANAKIGAGEFDLVIVPMAFGVELVSMYAVDPPRMAAPVFLPAWRGAEKRQAAVVWTSAAAPIAGAPLGPKVLLGGADLGSLGVGLVNLPNATKAATEMLIDSGKESTPILMLDRLSSRPKLRSMADRAAFFARLGHASKMPFLSVVSRIYLNQKESSPWALTSARFELTSDLLGELARATPDQPNSFERLAWNHLAQTLVTKRMVSESLAVFPNLLERIGRWPELEYALARAELELLLNEEAATLLQRLYDENLLTGIQLVEFGNCLNQLGRWEPAAEAFDKAFALLPNEPRIEGWRAIARLRAGLPGSLEALQTLFEADSGNLDLAPFIKFGPLPPVPSGFNPTPLKSAQEPF